MEGNRSFVLNVNISLTGWMLPVYHASIETEHRPGVAEDKWKRDSGSVRAAEWRADGWRAFSSFRLFFSVLLTKPTEEMDVEHEWTSVKLMSFGVVVSDAFMHASNVNTGAIAERLTSNTPPKNNHVFSRRLGKFVSNLFMFCGMSIINSQRGKLDCLPCNGINKRVYFCFANDICWRFRWRVNGGFATSWVRANRLEATAGSLSSM